jgi:nicotinamidase-related amidase
VERLHQVEVPSTLAEVCRPDRLALVVYDMQEGILSQIDDRDRVVSRVGEVLDIARDGGIRTLFTRHITLPVELMGIAQLRMWRSWQGVDRLEEVRSPFPPDAPQTRVVSELAPGDGEAVLDKLTFSAFAGTPLELVLRGLGVDAVAVVGVATEIGIEPTVRHAGDLGFVPVVITDACGAGDATAGARSLETLKFLGEALLTDVEGFRAAVAGGR